MIISRTPVRLSFVGGGSDLPSFYERDWGAVLSTSINKYFYTVLTERPDGLVQIISSDLRLLEQIEALDPDACDRDLRIPAAVLRRHRLERGVNLFMASEIPPGTGLGSSASVCVNLLRAIWALKGREAGPYELAEEAFDVASGVLGEPVGKQDEYAAAFGGLNEIVFEPDGVTVLPLRVGRDVRDALERRLLLYFTGGSRRSAEILARQRLASRDAGSDVSRRLCEMRELVRPARECLEAGDLDGLGAILDTGWRLKRGISSRISSSWIDSLYEQAVRSGALGGKLTGAGGGGFLMLLARDGAQQEIRSAMRSAGLKEMRFRLDHQGSRVVYDDPYFDADETGGLRWSFIRPPAA